MSSLLCFRITFATVAGTKQRILLYRPAVGQLTLVSLRKVVWSMQDPSSSGNVKILG